MPCQPTLLPSAAVPHDLARDDDPCPASSHTNVRPCHVPPHVCNHLRQLSRRTSVNGPVCIGHRFARTWVEVLEVCLHGDMQTAVTALYRVRLLLAFILVGCDRKFEALSVRGWCQKVSASQGCSG
eukprot:5147645-Amphidinium_carterae.1